MTEISPDDIGTAIEGKAMKIRDRIKELRRVPARELRPNPKNWRTHPKEQQDALRGVLAEIGFADALLARVDADGGLILIDGHLRAETAADELVPVLILDVDEAEAAKILATLDPLGAMAEADGGKLKSLLDEIETGSAAVQAMLDGLGKEHGLDTEEEAGEPVPTQELPDRYAIIIECATEDQQLELLKSFEQEGLNCRALIV